MIFSDPRHPCSIENKSIKNGWSVGETTVHVAGKLPCTLVSLLLEFSQSRKCLSFTSLHHHPPPLLRRCLQSRLGRVPVTIVSRRVVRLQLCSSGVRGCPRLIHRVAPFPASRLIGSCRRRNTCQLHVLLNLPGGPGSSACDCAGKTSEPEFAP